jgi:hypothetical protein
VTKIKPDAVKTPPVMCDLKLAINHPLHLHRKKGIILSIRLRQAEGYPMKSLRLIVG